MLFPRNDSRSSGCFGQAHGVQFDPRPVLAADFPDLAIRTVEELGEGWDHIAYLVNDDLVFRLPWAIVEGPTTDEPEPCAAREIGLLRELAGQLPVEIPEPIFVAPGQRYFGYPYLPGRSLDPRFGAARSGPGFGALVVEVAVAVEQLVPIDRAEELGLTPDDHRDDLSTAYAALPDARLTPQMRSVGERALAVLGDQWRAAAARRSVTMHADFGLDHFITNDDGDVYALIDWTDACIAPAENHFRGLMWHAPDLLTDIIRRYERKTGAPVDRELIFAAGYVNGLGDIGELTEEDPVANADEIEWCLRFLRTWSDPELMATLDVLET